MSLGEYTKPEEGMKCYQQFPGFLKKPFFFKIKENPEKYQAICVVSFGTNPNKTTPVVAWIVDEKDNVYNPEEFFGRELGKIWRDESQTSRFFTLFGESESLKISMFRSVEHSKINEIPLACFTEGSQDAPITFIDKEAVYGKYIHFVSEGRLKEVVELYKEYEAEIDLAYPFLKKMNSNILNVYDNSESLKWFDEHKSNLVDNIISQQVDLKNFDDLDKMFQKLYNSKKEYEKGILGIVSKAFAYIPY